MEASEALKYRPFLIDPQLGGMGASSFHVWHVIASILDGDGNDLSADDLALAHLISQRTRFPTEPITEFYAGPGRRSGKTRFGECRARYRLAQDYRDKLAPGEYAIAACVAPTTEQAQILFNYARAAVMQSPLLSAQVVRETATEIEFAHRTLLKVYAGSFRSTRGMTFCAVFIDEASFLRSDDSALPDVELVRAVKPGLLTLNGDLIVMSSPYMKRGLMFEAHRKHFGNNDSRALYVTGDSRTFNPLLDDNAIRQAFEDDPESAAAEFGGNFRADLSAAFAAEWIERAVCSGVFARARVAVTPQGAFPAYVSFTDPAGGSGRDSWTTSVVHMEHDDILQDAVLEIRPPFTTTEAAKQVAEFLKSYGLRSTRGDAYAGAWPRDALALHGIGYTQSELPKSDIYRECVALFSGGRVKILDHARQTTQLRMLERRTRAGGKDSFDHPAGSNDDIANSLCGALLAASRTGASKEEVWSGRSAMADSLIEMGVAQNDYSHMYITGRSRFPN
ncbi:MAG: hypothetical protein WDO56_03880 [Gammaproteobacteria bacterium]